LKVVITGGAGFIGSHLAQYWSEKNAEVFVIDNFRTGFKKNIDGLNVNLIEGSIEDKDLVFDVLEKADYVFNLAALVSVPESIEKPEECIKINVNGLLNLLEASKKHKVKKLIHTSSAAVYGDDPELPKTTKLKPNPKSPYGITKLDGEYYCNLYKEEFGVNTTSLRYFNVYGERQDPKSQYAAAVPIFISKALKNEDITIFGDGSQTRDFVYVKDIVKANVMAAENLNIKGVFNIANGSYITIKELAENIVKVTDSNSSIIHKPERAGDIKHSYASIEETTKEMGFQPDFNLEEGLTRTINYFKDIIG
jgi:UDP-glucose 4-epimerase